MNHLYRSRRQRVISGVAGGMAEYFDVDVVLVRVLWVIFAFMGAGVIAYIIAAFIIPENKDQLALEKACDRQDQAAKDRILDVESDNPGRQRRNRNLGLLLVGLGVVLLLPQVIPGYILHNFWPLLLVLLGVFLLIRGGKGE